MSKRTYQDSFGKDDQGYSAYPAYPAPAYPAYPAYPAASTSSYTPAPYVAPAYDPSAAYGATYDQSAYDPSAYAAQYPVDAYGPVFPQYPDTSTSTTVPTAATPVATAAAAAPKKELSLKELNAGRQKDKRIVRAAGGEIWEDKTLLEWDDNDFRVFAGDLGKEVTDETLRNAFSKYPSFLKARVVRDKRTGKSKGYGFLSFKDPADYARVIKEMNGKYIGNRPIKLRKSEWKDRLLENQDKKEFKTLKKIKDSTIGKA